MTSKGRPSVHPETKPPFHLWKLWLGIESIGIWDERFLYDRPFILDRAAR
jgi:hypothetical protein